MKSKLLIMIADNITPADVSSIDDISFLSFDGKRSMPISDKKSLDKAIGHIRDFYNVETFEDDTDVVIVYDKLSSEMIEYFAASFVGCDKFGVIPFGRIIPEIIRNRKAELPAVLTFDHSSFNFGETGSSQSAPIDVELNDLLFLYYVSPDYFSDVSSAQLDELMQQLEASNKEKKELNEKVSVLSEQVKNLGVSLSNKIAEMDQIKKDYEKLKAQVDAENAKKRKLTERSIVYLVIPDNVWNARNDWNAEHKDKYDKARLYMNQPCLSGKIKKGQEIAGLFWSFTKLSSSEIGNLQFANPNDMNHGRVSAIISNDYLFKRNYLNKRGISGLNYSRNLNTIITTINGCCLISESDGRLFRLIKETDEITEQKEAIAVIGNESDTREDIDKWLAEIGRSDLKCV